MLLHVSCQRTNLNTSPKPKSESKAIAMHRKSIPYLGVDPTTVEGFWKPGFLCISSWEASRPIGENMLYKVVAQHR